MTVLMSSDIMRQFYKIVTFFIYKLINERLRIGFYIQKINHGLFINIHYLSIVNE